MIRWVRALLLVLVLPGCGESIPPPKWGTGAPPVSNAPPVPAPVPAPVEPPAGGAPILRDASSAEFEPEIRAFEQADRAQAPAPGGIVFVGSSSIRLWKTLERDFPRHRVKNRGFGGARIRNVTDYADRIVVPYAPRLVVFFAGTNDIHAGSTADRVVADFRAFVERVRASLPNVAIAFVSITTSPSRFAEVETVKEANRRIREFVATDARMSFIDVFSKMVDAAGAPLPELYGDDKLHLNQLGYAGWVKVIGPALGPPD